MNADDFLDLVRRSGLVEPDRLSRAVSPMADEASTSLAAQWVADFLVESGVLTRWQAEKLLEGKWKGFYLGEYKLLGLLGVGGTSSIYLAEHVPLARKVAIKVLPPLDHRLGDFFNEAEAAAVLQHPNIAKLLEVAEHDGTHFCVMEYVAGRDLATVVAEDGPVPVPQAVDYIFQAAKGLEYAHAMGVIHGSIAPSKLILTSCGLVMIVGMGRVARQSGEGLTDARGNRTVDDTRDGAVRENEYQADIFGLGCTLFWVLSGGPPSVSTLLGKRTLRDARTDVPEALASVFRRMASGRAEERYQSMAEVIKGLQSAC